MHGEHVLGVIIGDMIVFLHLPKGKGVCDGVLVAVHRSVIGNISFMVSEFYSSAQMDLDGFSRDSDVGHQIRVSEDVSSGKIVQQYPPWWKAPSSHVCHGDGVLCKGDVSGPNIVARFVVLLLLLHSRNHLVLTLLFFGLIGLIRRLFNLSNLIPSIIVHLRVPCVIGTTASVGISVVNHQLLEFILHILVPDLGAL